MEHSFVHGIQKALGWSGPQQLGNVFAHGALPENDLCARLLTPTRLLDLVMRRSLTMHGLRCLVNGADLHPRDYLGQSPARRGHSVPIADMRRIGHLLQSGCTLILDMAHFFDPTLEVACRALQWWSHEIVQVNIYLTTGDAAGFELHWDDHDVIVVQLAGEKHWEVRGLSRPAPMYRDAAPNPDPPDDVVWAGTMQAGDIMHIPRGYWHQATRQDRGNGFSLHATFGFMKRTGVDWLTWLADHSREQELFRHDIDQWGTANDRATQQRALTDEVVHLAATRSAAQYLAAREQERPAARHVATHGVFGAPSSVVCVSEFPPVIAANAKLVTVRAAGKEITLAAKTLPAVQLLLSGEPVTVADVTKATGINAAELADVFLAEELCAEITAELAAGYLGWVS